MYLTTVINYCTNDYRYLAKCIQEASIFSQKIVLPVCDHFFDGKKEDRDLLNLSYAGHTHCQFVEFAYHPSELYSPFILRKPADLDWKMFWYSTARYVSFFFLPPETEYVLFLDVDEIVEGQKFAAWLSTKEYLQHDAFRFDSYYYFREAKYRAREYHHLALLIKKELLTPSLILNPDDRYGMLARASGKKREEVRSLDNKPMIHHYSGVKTKEEWVKKADCSGHDWEKEWKIHIDEEFKRPFNGKDFTFDCTYETVEPFFDPLAVTVNGAPAQNGPFPHVCKVDKREIFQRDLQFQFGV